MPAYRPPDAATLAWLGRVVGGEVREVVRLRGGISAAVDRISVGGHEVVLKRWIEHDADEPPASLVTRESAALTALAGSGIPAPTLLAADPSGDDAGGPCLAMSLVPGEPVLVTGDLAALLPVLAATQAAIHALPADLAAAADGWFDPEGDLEWIADAGLRRDVRAAVAAPGRQSVFAHGDYQPFNVLWRGDSLGGVVDWTNAGTGPRGIDVGHCRLNLAVLAGPDAADAYLRAYEQAAGVTVDPGTDLRALLHFDLEWPEFIPVQLAGRAGIDVATMPDRVLETVRRTLDRFT